MRPSGRTPQGRESEREVAAAWPMLIAQTKSELLQLLRDPAFIISSVTLPTIFFAFFGLPVVDERIAGTGDYLLASFGAYGVISVMLFSFGAGVAAERGRKTDVLMRATPLRPASCFAPRPFPPSSSPRSWSCSSSGGSQAASSRGWPPGRP